MQRRGWLGCGSRETKEAGFTYEKLENKGTHRGWDIYLLKVDKK